MKWHRRQAEIAKLRRITPKWKVPFPDLTCDSGAAPTSNTIAVPGSNTEVKVRGIISLPDFVVATTHKQGPAVHHRRELPYLGGRKI